MSCLLPLPKVYYGLFLVLIFPDDYVYDVKPLVKGVHADQTCDQSDNDIYCDGDYSKYWHIDKADTTYSWENGQAHHHVKMTQSIISLGSLSH